MNNDSEELVAIEKEKLKQATYVYAVERFAVAIENLSEDFKVMFTNPLGIGDYLKLLGAKEDVLAYSTPLIIFALFVFAFCVMYGSPEYGIKTILIISGLVILLALLRFWENYQKRKESREQKKRK
jgi:hypothetical protein